jgi:hypothetical protein
MSITLSTGGYDLIEDVIARSSARSFGNIVTGERRFGIAIDQWMAGMLADNKSAATVFFLNFREALGGAWHRESRGIRAIIPPVSPIGIGKFVREI